MSETRDNAVVHIDAMLSQLLSSASSSNPKIFKVFNSLRQVNEKAYDPVLLAIGPIHHYKDNLKNMEHYKMRYLNQLLDKRKETSVKRYMVELRKCEEKSRQFYENSIQLPESDKFIEMLLLDGIFVIELLRKYFYSELRGKDDDLFQFGLVFNQIQRDLVLIENQLPFFIVSQLFEMTKSSLPFDNLQHLFLEMMKVCAHWMCPVVNSQIYQYKIDDHLTGLFYTSNFSNEFINGRSLSKYFNLDEIKTISELKEVGIKFKRSHGGGNWTDASFKNGVLRLPFLKLYDQTESLLRNLIAYEQMLPNEHPRPMTNYAILMESLIHSAKDVEILRRAGIIRTCVGNDETAHVMINKLGENITANHWFTYSDVMHDVNGFCRRRHRRWMILLKRNYFNSPWAILSFIAGTILLLLAAVQTVLAMLSYSLTET